MYQSQRNVLVTQLIVELAIVIAELRKNIKTNSEASNALSRLAECNPALSHIPRCDLADILPPSVNIKSLTSRLSQLSTHWELPFPCLDDRIRLCNTAKLLNSGKNNGVLGQATVRDEDKQFRKKYGGSFLVWKCNICKFGVKYHATQNNLSDIESTTEIRRPGQGHITLRAVFLARSHLHMQEKQVLRYACLFCIGNGRRLEKGSTAFTKEDELANHVDRHHDAKSLPHLFMKKLYVAAPGERPESRYDIQFLRTR